MKSRCPGKAMQKRVFTVWNEFSLDWLCVARLTKFNFVIPLHRSHISFLSPLDNPSFPLNVSSTGRNICRIFFLFSRLWSDLFDIQVMRVGYGAPTVHSICSMFFCIFIPTQKHTTERKSK